MTDKMSLDEARKILNDELISTLGLSAYPLIRIIDDLISAASLVARSEQREEIREFLANASVWDSQYIYHSKVRMLEQFDEKFNSNSQQNISSNKDL